MDGNAMGVERWHECVISSPQATNHEHKAGMCEHVVVVCISLRIQTCILLLQNYGRHAVNAITVAYCGFADAVRVERKEPRP